MQQQATLRQQDGWAKAVAHVSCVSYVCCTGQHKMANKGARGRRGVAMRLTSDAASMCVGAKPIVCACGHADNKDVAANRRGGACGSRPTCQPCYKNRPMHTKSKGQTHTLKVLCTR